MHELKSRIGEIPKQNRSDVFRTAHAGGAERYSVGIGFPRLWGEVRLARYVKRAKFVIYAQIRWPI
jgi:hypothetical protein